MIRSGLLAVTICAALASGLFGVGICSADPGPMDPGYCGARQDPLDCVPYDGPMPPPPNRGEAIFLNNVREQYPGDDATLLTVGRGTCNMLHGGVTTSYTVRDIAGHLRTTEAHAGQLLITAMEYICPGLTVGTDGVARPSR